MAFATSSTREVVARWSRRRLRRACLRPKDRRRRRSPVEPLLKGEHLSLDYEVGAGTFHALRGVSFEMMPGRVGGIVGGAGWGKRTPGPAIPRLLPGPPARAREGRVVFPGEG